MIFLEQSLKRDIPWIDWLKILISHTLSHVCLVAIYTFIIMVYVQSSLHYHYAGTLTNREPQRGHPFQSAPTIYSDYESAGSQLSLSLLV